MNILINNANVLLADGKVKIADIAIKDSEILAVENIPETFKAEKVIEARTYQTVYGPWTYFTADDGQIELWQYDYLVIGTIESYYALKEYFGDDVMVPLYIEVEDGLRLSRALERERAQTKPQYAELCRRFLADAEDFSEENLERAGIKRRFQNIDKETCMEEILREINVNL